MSAWLSLQELNGATMWAGPAFKRGVAHFSIEVATPGQYCRHIALIIRTTEGEVTVPCGRLVRLFDEGFEIFAGGLLGQLRKMLSRVGGFESRLLADGSLHIKARFYDESSRDPLEWRLQLSHDRLMQLFIDSDELDQTPESPARCFADLYPVLVDVRRPLNGNTVAA